MSGRDNQENGLNDEDFPSKGTSHDVTSVKMRARNWIHCPLCNKKLFFQKEIQDHFRNHHRSGQKKK